MRQLNQASSQLIKNEEGLRLRAYIDAVGRLTVGYGHTGSDVYAGQVISVERANQLFQLDVSTFGQGVEQSVTVSLNDNQFGALVSFAYNVGLGNFEHSTLLKKLNTGDYTGVQSEFARWNKGTVDGQKVKLPGLISHRAHEATLFATPVSANIPVTPIQEKQNILSMLMGLFKKG